MLGQKTREGKTRHAESERAGDEIRVTGDHSVQTLLVGGGSLGPGRLWHVKVIINASLCGKELFFTKLDRSLDLGPLQPPRPPRDRQEKSQRAGQLGPGQTLELAA